MAPKESPRVRVSAWIAFGLALAVRLYWVFRVQSPYASLRSDMGGYAERARELVSGAHSSFPRMAALYPFGTHYVFAAEFWLFGFDRHPAVVCTLHAIACASGAYFLVRFASRMFRGDAGPLATGLLYAIWQPVVWPVGYFLSEVPFLALLYCNAWLCLRFAETRRGALLTSLTGAVLFTIRPQVLVAFGLLGLAYLWTERSRLVRPRFVSSAARLAAPWVLALTFSAARHRELTGRWGLISENSALNRLFADTTIGEVDASWRAPNGARWRFTVIPPAKWPIGEREAVAVNGYLGDPAVLEPLRASRLRGKSLLWRARRAVRNVRWLWDENQPWPEEDDATHGLRRTLERRFGAVTRRLLVPLTPVAAVALPARPALVIVLSHLATLIVMSMFFFPEARYRVPYDPFLILLVLAAAARIANAIERFVVNRDARSRVRRAAGTP